MDLKVMARLREVAGRGDDWWSSLSPKQKREYIAMHPNSKYAKRGTGSDKSKTPAKKAPSGRPVSEKKKGTGGEGVKPSGKTVEKPNWMKNMKPYKAPSADDHSVHVMNSLREKGVNDFRKELESRKPSTEDIDKIRKDLQESIQTQEEVLKGNQDGGGDPTRTRGIKQALEKYQDALIVLKNFSGPQHLTKGLKKQSPPDQSEKKASPKSAPKKSAGKKHLNSKMGMKWMNDAKEWAKGNGLPDDPHVHRQYIMDNLHEFGDHVTGIEMLKEMGINDEEKKKLRTKYEDMVKWSDDKGYDSTKWQRKIKDLEEVLD